MRKLSKKISMLMVLAMLVGLFSGVVSASAASAWSFTSSKYDVAVNGSINMESKEYADFDLLKDGKAPAGYTVKWASSDKDVVWVNAKTGQLRANKFGVAEDGDKAVISATFTNTATKKSATRSFTIVLGAAKDAYTVTAADATIALGEEVKFAPVVKNAAGKTVKFATHKSYNGYFLDGKAIANPWTPEEAGEYTVTVAQFAKKADKADLAKAVRKTEVKVTVTVDDFSAKATGIKEITVYGDFDKDAKFTVKKGTGIAVTVNSITVAEDGKSAVLALKNKITKGVYTVSYGDASVSLDCEDEKPAKVIIEEKDGVAAVSADRTEAYAHYDVLNQYGESIRKSTSVQVSSSSNGETTYNRATGRVVMSTTGDASFIYGSQIVLNIAATGYSAFESAIMTAGMEDSVNAVKIEGLTLADSNVIVDEIPVNFLGAKDESTSTTPDEEATYFYLLFQRLDRSGHEMEVPTTAAGLDAAMDELFFASLNPMLVKEFGDELETKRINGVNYLAIKVVPGLMAKKGGVAPIEIRSNKTGGATPYDVRVVSDQILSQFTILPYEDIIIKDTASDAGWNRRTKVTLSYEAIDTNGETITDFRALYDRVSFSSSDVTFEEDWDGSAKLTYTVNWDNVNPTKDFDVPVVINAIVPEGSGNTITLYVKEARYIDNIDGYYGNNTLLEDSAMDINLGTSASWMGNRVQVTDQYDEVLGNDTNNLPDYVGNSTFFNGTTANKRALYYGVKLTGGAGLSVSGSSEIVEGYYVFNKDTNLKLVADEEVTDKYAQYTVEFVLLGADKKALSASAKAYTFYVADIDQATRFELGTVYGANTLIENNNADSVTFEVKAHFSTGGSAVLNNANTAAKKYYVTYTHKANVYTAGSTTGVVYGWGVASGATLKADIYDGLVGPLQHATQFHNVAVLNPDGTYGNRNVPVDVEAKVFVGAASGSTFVAHQLRDTLKGSASVGNHERKFVVMKADGGIQATDAVLTWKALADKVTKITDNYDDSLDSNSGNAWKENKFGFTVTISNLKEDLTNGLKYGNLKLVNNAVDNLIAKPAAPAAGATQSVKDEYNKALSEASDNAGKVVLSGVEVGDSFTATFSYENAKVVVDYVVGPDKKAYIKGNVRVADDVIWY